MRHFRWPFVVTTVLTVLAGWWGYAHRGWPGLLQALWISAILGVLEVSLCFDNAVVNASVRKHWNEFWRKWFLTVGIVVALLALRCVIGAFAITNDVIIMLGLASSAMFGRSMTVFRVYKPARRAESFRCQESRFAIGARRGRMGAHRVCAARLTTPTTFLIDQPQPCRPPCQNALPPFCSSSSPLSLSWLQAIPGSR